MASRLELLVDLLHGAGEGALATHSVAMPGYPFATAVPFATDEHHRPVLLISRLAEHTRNLAADGRAGFLLSRLLGDGEMARVSLVGTVSPIEASPALARRYLRYQPDGARFLELGDFRFHRFQPLRIRVVGGFAQAGWLDGARLLDTPSVSPEEESRLLDDVRTGLPAGAALLGVDAYGADYLAGGMRGRVSFDTAPLPATAIPAALERALAKL
jgi:hypothetical protein